MSRNEIEIQAEEAAGHAVGLLRSRYGLWALAGISFIESALVVPIITDPFLVAHILANKLTARRTVIVTTISSVLGGVFAYAFAFYFYEFIAARYLVGTIGEQFYTIVSQFQDGIFVLTLLGAFTPIPYTLIAIAAGFVSGNIFLFVLASVLGRGIRYSIVGLLTHRFGEQALAHAKKRILLVSILSIVAAGLYFFLK